MRPLALTAAVLLALSGPLSSLPLDGDWHPFNQQELTRFLRQHQAVEGARASEPRPYAVFDWDNTCVFLDVEEATLAFQLETMTFQAPPADMDRALRFGVPDDPHLHALLADVRDSYAWLWLRLRAGGRLEEVQGRPHHREFRAKFLSLYQSLERLYGTEVAYRWLPQRFYGMTADQVAQTTLDAVRWQRTQPVATIVWESPPSLSSQAGPIRASWRSGLRLSPEIRSLWRALEQAGFDLWVCTASFATGIEAVAREPEFGYRLPPDRVLGLKLESDPRGRFQFQPQAGSEFTYQEGKSQAIRRHLLPRYGGRGPDLVVGDSQGDVAMMTAFPETDLVLILDTQPDPESPLGRLIARGFQQRGTPGAQILVQARDPDSGRFVP